jgi:hypothetical protein
MKVTAFTRYDRQAASTRQRLLQYLPALAAAGIEVRYEPLLGDDYVRTIVSGASFSRRNVARAYLGRLRELLFRPAPDVVWIYAELFPLSARLGGETGAQQKPGVVCDFDDAFFHNYDASPNAAVRTLLGRKLQPLLKRAAACCCGNAYLEEYASRFCPEQSFFRQSWTAKSTDRVRG